MPNRPSQRARMRFLEKSSALEFSDYCTPMPWESVSIITAPCARTWLVPAASLTVATMGTLNSRRLARSYGSDSCSTAFAAG